MNSEQNQKTFTQEAVRKYLQSLNGHGTNQLYNLVIEETERGLIKEVLLWCEGNQTQASQILGITRTTLRNKIKKLNISHSSH